ncbi:PadR family transcriptional regulator [Candidatus Falkowbacteria bacterium HGW-Falkowbacteria-1]|jgi:PadR family transcriptional regulator PadR|uniref:PadR family transcriptional regulator n=1 Tax=Candidatus Falkowbacteria bacterium HGW-Falkowbacteria-1 TaxID=2013768 RepID=A0A2N2EAN0_9BACT|nr:MAG: PadR family transcriptional regulator [Candidatus Falkowbacteria bacterium HGW-Falkowbacteria-1]
MNIKTQNDTENTKAQMRKGFLEFLILLMISKEKMYASDILKKLKMADLIVVEGTLYPLLMRLKNSELLEYVWEESKSGPPRKYYTITKDGLGAIKELSKTWFCLYKAINILIKDK